MFLADPNPTFGWGGVLMNRQEVARWALAHPEFVLSTAAPHLTGAARSGTLYEVYIPYRLLSWRIAMQQEIALTEARAKLGELVDLVRYRDETIVLVKSGKPAAALVPVEWLERYQRERATAFQVVDAVRTLNADAAASEDELQQIVASAIRAVRSEK